MGINLLLFSQLIPDITFEGSTSSTGNPNATFTLQARNGPGSTYATNSSGQSTRTASTPVEQFTDIVDVRLRGRSFSLKLESTDPRSGLETWYSSCRYDDQMEDDNVN